jgi:hypothetical protein
MLFASKRTVRVAVIYYGDGLHLIDVPMYCCFLFQRPLHDFTLPIRYLNNWFPQSENQTKRHEIRRLIVQLMHKLNPTLNYNPAQDGCDVE